MFPQIESIQTYVEHSDPHDDDDDIALPDVEAVDQFLKGVEDRLTVASIGGSSFRHRGDTHYRPVTSHRTLSPHGWQAVTVGCVRTLIAVVSVSVLATAGCGGGETTTAPGTAVRPSSPAVSSSPSIQPPPSESVTESGEGTLITTAESQFGEVLFDGTGQAIYLFDIEPSTSPECYDECAEAWPPVLTDGEPKSARGARSDALGTTIRTDGTMQVTYAGHPLYYYAHEGKNQVLCHDVRDFGGLWLAVTPSGDPAAT